MANVDEIGFFNHAEQLGYDSVWVTDSQMLFSDCYAVLGPRRAPDAPASGSAPGTAICGTRIPPVQVAAVATLNRLAPGRMHLRHRDRQHRHAHDGPAADAGRPSTTSTCACSPPSCAVRGRRLRATRRG